MGRERKPQHLAQGPRASKGTFVQKDPGSGVDSSDRRQNAIALGLFECPCHSRQEAPGRGV